MNRLPENVNFFDYSVLTFKPLSIIEEELHQKINNEICVLSTLHRLGIINMRAIFKINEVIEVIY